MERERKTFEGINLEDLINEKDSSDDEEEDSQPVQRRDAYKNMEVSENNKVRRMLMQKEPTTVTRQLTTEDTYLDETDREINQKYGTSAPKAGGEKKPNYTDESSDDSYDSESLSPPPKTSMKVQRPESEVVGQIQEQPQTDRQKMLQLLCEGESDSNSDEDSSNDGKRRGSEVDYEEYHKS